MYLSAIAALSLGQANIQVSRVRVLGDVHALSVAGAPTGSLFAASLEDNSVWLIDANTGATVRKLVGHPQPVYGLAFNRARTLIATGDESARIYLWNVSNGQKVREFTRTGGHLRGIQSISFSPDGKQLVTTGRDDFIIIWDVATGAPIKKIAGDGANVAAAAFNPAGGNFFSASLGKGLLVYPRAGGAGRSVGAHKGLGINEFAISNSGTRAISGGRDNGVTIWDVKSTKPVGSLAGHEDFVMHVAISPNGKFAVSSSADRSVRFWNLNSFKPVAVYGEQSGVGAPVAITGDGKYAISTTASDAVQISIITPAQGSGAVKVTTKRKRK